MVMFHSSVSLPEGNNHDNNVNNNNDNNNGKTMVLRWMGQQNPAPVDRW
jgi:hypothetical protein